MAEEEVAEEEEEEVEESASSNASSRYMTRTWLTGWTAGSCTSMTPGRHMQCHQTQLHLRSSSAVGTRGDHLPERRTRACQQLQTHTGRLALLRGHKNNTNTYTFFTLASWRVQARTQRGGQPAARQTLFLKYLQSRTLSADAGHAPEWRTPHGIAPQS